MGHKISNALRSVMAGTAAAAVALSLVASAASAQEGLFGGLRSKTNETYIPTIWIDPDGCEHWVMDDGYEGFMSPHTNRQGIPVCRRGNVCARSDTKLCTPRGMLPPPNQTHAWPPSHRRMQLA